MSAILFRMAMRCGRRAALLLAAPVVAASFLAPAASASSASSVPAAGPASYVDPMIGTGNGGGHVGAVDEYPGPDAPFGMVQWGPDTGPSNVPVGYYYDNSTMTGFSLTRLSGVGCGIFRDFQFLPTTKAVTTSPGTAGGWNTYTSGFSHSQETATAGYYSVTTANGIRTELTTGTRAALGRFTYPPGSPATMLINASSSYGNHGSTLRVVSPDTITGSATGGGFCLHKTVNYTVYFAVTFDRPFSSYGTWNGGTATPGSSSVSGDGAGGWLTFDTSASTVINARVAISYVSVAGAESNLATIGTNFDAVRAQTYQQWNRLLGEIDVTGGTVGEKTTFYTALYHALLDPSTYSDADGKYMGFDFKVHTVPKGHVEYTDFSGWDIYRSEVPLLALLAPHQVSDMMQSLVNDAEQGGWLPKWPTANTYTGMMGGDAADPIIAGAYAFGARHFDVRAALRYMLKGADDTTSPPGQGVYVPRGSYIQQAAWNDYLALGYVPTGPSSAPFGTALTEEFALADFSIGQFAGAIGDRAVADTFARRGQNWQNVFDPGSGYVVPRGPQAPATGDPATQQYGFEEGNAAQYTWMVPQNFAALFAAMGGRSAAASRLDKFFTQINAGSAEPYDWAGNEVTLGAPWAYDYAGQPWKTQATVRQIITQLYSPTPGGEPGNDDLGAMSSWYVWAALGLYPETPGTSTLALGSPLFPHAVIHLGNGRTITINAPQAAPGAPYVQNLTVNGRPWPADYLTARQYARGATLDYTLGTAPDTMRGTRWWDAPPSYGQGEAPAIGFTTPWGAATATRGAATTVQVGAQSVVRRWQKVRWSVTAPSGIGITPSSGALMLKPGQQGTQPVSIGGIGASLPTGTYPVHFTFTDPAGRRISTADLYVHVAPPLVAAAAEPNLDLAAGGWNQATYTITNNVHSGPMDVTFSGSGPAGVTSTLSATSAEIPAGGSVKVTAAFTNPGITTGTGNFTLTATDAADHLTVTAASELHYTSNLALNAYRTPFPAPTATSSQGLYPPYLAVDGSTSTFWVSGDFPADGKLDFEENFGAPVSIGSITMTPRPDYGPSAYSIQTSTDGQNWTTIATVTSAAKTGATTTAVAPGTAQYLRLVTTSTYHGNGVQIEELAVTSP